MSELEVCQRSARPVIFTASGLCDREACETIVALTRDEAWLTQHDVTTHRGPHGTSWELPSATHPTLAAIASRALALAALPDAELSHLRVRRTGPGQGHPPHLDDHVHDGARLVATVLITLISPEEGGHTRFPRALPEPMTLRPASGDALLWYNIDAQGDADPRGWHDGEPVARGEKITLGCFIYARLDTLSDEARARLSSGAPQRLYVIADAPASELVTQLQHACWARDVACVVIDPDTFDHVTPPALEVGAMLYRVATSHAACVVEQSLTHASVASCYHDPLGAHLIWENQSLLLARYGVPTPRAFHALTTHRPTLRRQVEALGGFPVILKVPGRSHGVGVMRLESWPALFSVAEQVEASRGGAAILMSCVAPATHWRVLVVGQRAAACYINRTRRDDFRTWVDEDAPDDFTTPPPAQVIEVAVRACQVLGLDFGGVDVLHHPSGRVYVLEVNAPCYFGHPLRGAGVDVADALVAMLQDKARALRALAHEAS